MAKKKRQGKKWGILIFAILFVIAAYLFIRYYQKVFKPNANLKGNTEYIYVPTGISRAELVTRLMQTKVLKDSASFIWVANEKEYLTPKPGKYKISDGMNNNELVNLLRSGKQEPIQLTFNSIRTPNDLAKKIARQIEADSMELYQKITSGEVAERYGFNSETFLTLFIPNTYEFYWNTSADEFISRMAKEYKRFWNSERIAKANELELKQSEVSILASIVQAEQMQHPDERPKVAGLYLNRLDKQMKLQSDPTLIYAMNDFSIKRVLNKHMEMDSPYNTYKYEGLPPGPINLPEISSIDAVLNPEEHEYIYMCAKADFSGYHHFSKSFFQHNAYAQAYRNELNKRNIMK